MTPSGWKTASAHLRRRDRALGRIITKANPPDFEPQNRQSPFEALLRSIIYQQLSGKAAGSIHRRLLDLFPRRRPSARRLLELDDDAFRGAGLSRAKILAARDLAEKAAARRIPSRSALDTMDDDAIIERLVEIRGIGRWTVEMMLMSTLGRPDVLPATDLGVRRGFMLYRGDDEMPTPADLLAHGERWRPFRSVASWYLWRACEL